MTEEYRPLKENSEESEPLERQFAKDNVEHLSSMLKEEEETVSSQSWGDFVRSKEFKITAVTAAATSIMGITGLMKKEKPKEYTPPPVEPAPIVEVAELPQNLPIVEDEEASVTIEMPVEADSQTVEQVEPAWWHDVPPISQRGLVYHGRENDYGCVPSSVSMITEYWHQKNSDHETASAQELLNANAGQGEFNSTGMSITRMQDDLSTLGYEAVDYADADLDTLKQKVTEGPVVAVVKLGISEKGEPHSVVVTGISENNEVRVNDPWTGEARTYSWETFSRSWGSRFKGVSSRNHFTVIKPSEAFEKE